MWDRPREKLYQRPESFLEGVHPEDRARMRAVLERQSREETDETCRIIRHDGAIRWIRARTFPIWNVLGQAYRTAGIAEDITERVQAYQILEQRVEERTRELSTLLEISRHVALTIESEPLLDLILDQLRAVVGYDDAAIFKLEGDELTALAHRGTVPREEMLEQRFSLQQAPFVRQMILNQETVIIPDVRDETPLAQGFRQAAGTRLDTLYAGVRSWMGTPLAIKDQVIGILTLKHSAVNHFAPEQVDLVLGFGNQAAVAIENNRLYEQAQVLAAVEERQRLARDLHDAVSQTLFSASLAAEVLPRLWENRPAEGRRCLAELQQLTRGALAEMRTLLLELRPAALVEVALDDLLRQLAEAASTRALLPVGIALEERPTLPPEVHVALYRIAQEALNNVVKHAGASQAAVSLRFGPVPPLSSPPQGGTEGRAPPRAGETAVEASPPTGGIEGGWVELRIEDDGRGFDPADVPADRLGLSIMRERAAAVGAEMSIQSRSGHGTQVVVAWPGAT
jgi:two-component system nitrate/nitrite sensor histidine kinase NarX